jgi:hypothetical protein
MYDDCNVEYNKDRSDKNRLYIDNN